MTITHELKATRADADSDGVIRSIAWVLTSTNGDDTVTTR